jgi:hypothetical protein
MILTADIRKKEKLSKKICYLNEPEELSLLYTIFRTLSSFTALEQSAEKLSGVKLSRSTLTQN